MSKAILDKQEAAAAADESDSRLRLQLMLLTRNGVRCLTIAPGIFGTPMMFGTAQEVQDSLAASVPFPSRLGTPTRNSSSTSSRTTC